MMVAIQLAEVPEIRKMTIPSDHALGRQKSFPKERIVTEIARDVAWTLMKTDEVNHLDD